ncbi:hypothetical protein SeMB42_g02525 [Synchytrium endobioticum]|uniref:NAD(P)-binding domain-containing protein n=1 Tax=Synchytrium endobioticum TaxID=286115 RepID=A0A507DFJ5_9FUNG|nr:hypothetical protein SeMB42_g02525 [Synchytrium endobioticum]
MASGSRAYHIGLFGATGATGLHILKQSLQHDKLTILARTPSKLATFIRDSPNVSVIQGDTRNPHDVDKVVASGIDGVINCVGGGTAMFFGGEKDICQVTNKHIVQSMQTHGVSRLVTISGIGVGSGAEFMPWYMTLGRMAVQPLMHHIMDDKEKVEALVTKSGLDYTIVRPPVLTNGPLCGRYRAGVDVVGLSVARADLAHFMLRVFRDEEYAKKIGQTPTIAY